MSCQEFNKVLRRERLLMLLKVLESVPDERFSMEVWQSECGTVRSAVAWAACEPWFNVRGFRFDRLVGMPAFGGFYGYRACALFFNLSETETRYLLCGDRDTTRDVIVERIDRLLGAEPMIGPRRTRISNN